MTSFSVIGTDEVDVIGWRKPLPVKLNICWICKMKVLWFNHNLLSTIECVWCDIHLKCFGSNVFKLQCVNYKTVWTPNIITLWKLLCEQVLYISQCTMSPCTVHNHLLINTTTTSALWRSRPLCVANVVMYLLLGACSSWWYPLLRSIFENIFDPFMSAIRSSMVFMGYRSLSMGVLMDRLSKHSHLAIGLVRHHNWIQPWRGTLWILYHT